MVQWNGGLPDRRTAVLIVHTETFGLYVYRSITHFTFLSRFLPA